MQTAARIYFQFGTTIWAMLNMGESLAMIAGSWIPIEGLTVTWVASILHQLRHPLGSCVLTARLVSTLLSIIGQFSGVISLSVPTWLAGVSTLAPETPLAC
jgi:hypothetical protein